LGDICNKIIQEVEEVKNIKGNEEDLKNRIERILRKEVWDALGVPEPRYEYRVESEEWLGVSAKHWGRIDALYGLVIFEYKKPSELEKASVREEAIKKTKEIYIPGLLNKEGIRRHIEAIKEKGFTPIITGIIWDGYNVIFVEYCPELNEFKLEPEVGFYKLKPETLRRIIGRVIAAYKKKIDARLLASDFGYRSLIVKKHLAVKKLYKKLENPSEKTQKLFDEWLRLTSQAFSISGEELRKIAEDYGFEKMEMEKIDGLKLFFAIQTYYALVIKLLSVEVAARFYNATIATFFEEVKRAIAENELKEKIEELETGYLYSIYKIKNFLEGEFFSWYLDEWDDEIEEIVRVIAEKLLEYDIESLIQEPSMARDVFKLLYEELVPRKEVRQKLGIYTTPDWLAELIINELTKDTDLINTKFLDPGAGTGTFLALVIKKMAKYKDKIGPKTLLKTICSNVIGFDIDSLAVLTARANYLIALASERLLEHKGEEMIEIPVYLANSIITARELEDTVWVAGKPVKVVEIEAGGTKFQIPSKLLDKALDLLNDFERFLEAKAPFDNIELQRRLESYKLTREERILIKSVYDKLLEFVRKEIDTVWIPILKTYIVSTYYRDFDFIVGNPPWLAYRFIADPDYQRKVKKLIKEKYGLVVEEHLMTHMEMATLFLIRCLDLYLKDGGSIGFVMPKSIMYSDQHDKFRRQDVKVEYKIEKFIDCKVTPLFYVPACAVIAKKETGKSYPVPTIIIEGKLPEDRHKVMSLSEALKQLKVLESELYLNLVKKRSFISLVKLEAISSRSHYYGDFYQGATIVPQTCWFVDVIDEKIPMVRTSRRAKMRGKIEYEIDRHPIEREFLYYVLTSAEVLPFCHLPPNVAVLPIKPHGNKYFLIRRETALDMGKVYLAKWLEKAEEIWEKVRGKKKVDLYEWLDYRNKLTKQNPNAKYKVVYLTSATHLASCIVRNEPSVIIDSTLYRYETNNENEAYYLVAILNSSVLDDLIKPMQAKGFSGVERHIHKKPLEFPIPKYNEKNRIHKRLSELGRFAADKAWKTLTSILKEKGYDKKLEERGTLVPTEVANLREAMRGELINEIEEIDKLTLELFKSLKLKKHTALDRFIR